MELFLLLFGHALAIFSAEDLSEDLNQLRDGLELFSSLLCG